MNLKIALSTLLISTSTFAQVLIQPLDMDETEFQRLTKEMPSHSPFDQNYFYLHSAWNSEFDSITGEWDQDAAKINLEMDPGLRRYLSTYILNEMTANKINSYSIKKLWQPGTSIEGRETKKISRGPFFRLFINGTETLLNEIDVPIDEIVQIVLLSNKLYPIIYWGKAEMYVAPIPEPFSKFKCRQTEEDALLLSKGLKKPVANCELFSEVKTVNPTKSSIEKWPPALPYLLGGLALLGGVYLAGYEVIWLGL